MQFTFKTQEAYDNARLTGFIDCYDIVRIKRFDSTGLFDFPVHTQEDFEKVTQNYNKLGIKFEAYASKHFFDIQDYDYQDFE
jgi:hypothetical protein